MIERSARIVAIHAQGMRVELGAPAACAACGAQRNCGGDEPQIQVEMPLLTGAREGDEVLLGMESAGLLRAAALAYLLPALALVLGAALGEILWQGNAGAALGAVLGLGCGLLLAREWSTHRAAEPCARAVSSATASTPNFDRPRRVEP